MARSSRSRTALVGGALAVTASLTAVVTGIATTTGPLATPAAAAELRAFGDCEELLEWYVDEALPAVGPWGLDGGIIYDPLRREIASSEAGADAGGASPDQAVSASGTGTNVQESGVDEPDRAKTDGELVVHVRGQSLVVTDVSGPRPRELGSLALPDGLSAPELLLTGDTVLVVASEVSNRPLPVEPLPGEPWPVDPLPVEPSGDVAPSRIVGPGLPAWTTPERSRLLEVSLADPSSPVVVSDRSFGGALVTARAHAAHGPYDGASTGEDTVRLVLRTDRPTIDFVRPDRDRTEDEALRHNRELVRESTIDDWLPSVRVDGGAARPLVECQDVRHPEDVTGETSPDYGTVTVVTMPATAPERATTTAVTTSSDAVYSSADRLYLAVASDTSRRTDVHAFALDGATTTYVASGAVDGMVRDRWAMDEHDGVLRLAVAHLDDTWTTRDNGVATLRERGGRLEVVGSVRGLGPEEEIKSVRWFDDLAVVVTFRQVDPLYTVDLTTPDRPRALGELKIPGFSEYLHPVGGDRLLGVGHDATTEGQLRGGQLSLFDVADLAAPARVATLPLGGRDVRPTAGWEPRSLTWLTGTAPGAGTALVAVADDATGQSWLAEVTVAEDRLVEGRRFPLPQWGAEDGRALPLPAGRVAVVGSELEVVQVTPGLG